MDLRPSTLTKFNTCEYKSHNDKKPFDSMVMEPGNLLNTAVNGTGHIDAFFKFFEQRLPHGLTKLQIDDLKKGMVMGRKEAERIRKANPKYFIEPSMRVPLDVDYHEPVYLTGTPDHIFYDEERKIRVVEDWKMSSEWRYGNQSIIETSVQRMAYPFMFMESIRQSGEDVNEIEFSFCLVPKKNPKKVLRTGTKTITYDQAREYILDVVVRYLDYVDGLRDPEITHLASTDNPACIFCPFNWRSDNRCPKRQREFKDDDDFL